jgi:hypothetical protein
MIPLLCKPQSRMCSTSSVVTVYVLLKKITPIKLAVPWLVVAKHNYSLVLMPSSHIHHPQCCHIFHYLHNSMQFPFVSTQTHKYLFIENGETDTKFKVCSAYIGYNIDVSMQTILFNKKFIIMALLFNCNF